MEWVHPLCQLCDKFKDIRYTFSTIFFHKNIFAMRFMALIFANYSWHITHTNTLNFITNCCKYLGHIYGKYLHKLKAVLLLATLLIESEIKAGTVSQKSPSVPKSPPLPYAIYIKWRHELPWTM